MNPEEIKDLTDAQVEILNNELHKRIMAIRDLCSSQAINSDWRAIMDDEASRNYFLRVLTSVACVADQGIKSGHFPNGEPVIAYQGSKAVLKFVIGCSIGEDVRSGKIKL